MHKLYEEWLWAWDWLTEEGASRATVILVFITALYALLTHRMARAMNRQTRAMIQPVLGLEFTVDEKEFHPKGRFQAKNLGTQPILLIDMRLRCRLHNLVMFDEYPMYERHILPPAGDIAFKFDFTKRYEDKGLRTWSPGFAAFSLEVVAGDLSEEVILTYKTFSNWGILSVIRGAPLRVHLKFFALYFKQRYFRIKYWLKPPKFMLNSDETPKRKARKWAWLKGKSAQPDSDSHDRQ